MKRPLIAFIAALLGGTPALAADLYVEDPAPVVGPGGWYLRGHLGMSNQRLGSMNHELMDDVAVHDFLDDGSFDSAPLAGGGIGYQFNDWLRLDGIVEYRGKADFTALDRYDGDGDGIWDGTNDYDGAKSEWLLMANAYVDIGDWYGVKPYVGAGIGASRNTFSGFRDINVPTVGVAYADEDSTWNFAWALHAGVAYQATERLAIDFGYSYVNLGDAKTDNIRSYDDTVNNAPMHFDDITSHDFKLGMRYALQ
ncbi:MULTISPECIES: porin family protein [unclassified Sinorhizobium]|uniref:outer membrane protein n=1 Tax=unclassified Sinorhizobium TaxID=2613772 RepID=UPI0024C2D950|nr:MULTISPECIES: porin family protein [unclassified Sinorhizobium]MDK1375209.1 porin family protein [Sinorhizobium sp. 6-70]MDK1478015.1 porin family protein [Sinorhizobium sp. 6-117]